MFPLMSVRGAIFENVAPLARWPNPYRKARDFIIPNCNIAKAVGDDLLDHSFRQLWQNVIFPI